MHSFHLHDVHVPRGPNLFFVSVGALCCFLLALATYMVAWLGGGDGIAAQLGGNTTLVVLVAGAIACAAFAWMTKPD